MTDLVATTYAMPDANEPTPGITYQWRVRATDGAGNIGDWSQMRQSTVST